MTIGCARAQPPARPNVLLVTIDTLRADRVGTGLAPTIDQLARAGVRFTSARSAVPLTLPSHATIHTGLLPPAHGVRENGVDVLAGTHPTVARLLKSAGYDTAAFVGAFVLDHRFGLAQGFDTYDDQIPRDPAAADRLEAERPAAAVVDHVLTWLDARDSAARESAARESAARESAIRNPQSAFFLWLHLYDPHAPYTPPDEFRRGGRSPYDGEIAYADSQLARVIEALRARGLLDRTVVAVAGDHGEGLGDHGERTHGMLLYDSTLRVPLILVAPGAAAATRDEAVSLADLAPTLLHAAGVAPPAEMTGRDLLAVRGAGRDAEVRGAAGRNGQVRGAVPGADLYSETDYPRVAGWSPLQALTDGRWKTIRAGAASEVYDVKSDPREEHDLSATQAAVAAAMSARTAAIHDSAGPAAARTISAEAHERLRALGYVASSVAPTASAGAANPSTRTAAWNDFEVALSALMAHRADALPALRRLASANPDAPVIQTTYARALKETGQIDAALTAYRAAATRWPGDAALLHDLAVAARDAAGAVAGARAAALRAEAARADQAALTLAPESAAAHNGVGLLLVEANRAADAVPWLERAIAAAPDLVEARLNLAIALQTAGQPARAAEEYRRVLTAPGNHPREKDAAAKLLAAMGPAR